MRLQDVLIRGTRAAQPAATAVSESAIYYVTDEGVVEQSDGAGWVPFSSAGGAATTDLGTRAAQPTALAAGNGALYFVTDEGVLERSNGTTWDDFSPSAAVATTDRGLRSAQPAATAVPAGFLYYVTDEGKTERSNGATWATYSGFPPARGTRAAQPAATAVPAGSLYFVTDESKIERSDGAVWAAYSGAAGGSRVIQVVTALFGAGATGTNAIPMDDTIPQITEGDEYMTLAITPTSATSKLKIDVVGVFRANIQWWVTVALFKDATANALAAAIAFLTDAAPVCFSHYMTAGTTSPITFRVRAGRHSASGTSVYFNGDGARRMGGVMASSITITEIDPAVLPAVIAPGTTKSDIVMADEAQASNTVYGDLTTVGPTVTVTMLGTVAAVWINVKGRRPGGGSGFTGMVGVEISGATTRAPDFTYVVSMVNGAEQTMNGVIFLTGLTPGTNTFRLKYRNDGGGTWNFRDRFMQVTAP